MISKELLSAVYGRQATKDGVVDTHNDLGMVVIMFDQVITDSEMEKTLGVFRYIDIHKLAHKCKEWAISKDRNIESSIYFHYKSSKVLAHAQVQKGIKGTLYSEFSTQGEFSEPEIIFKASEWILENA